MPLRKVKIGRSLKYFVIASILISFCFITNSYKGSSEVSTQIQSSNYASITTPSVDNPYLPGPGVSTGPGQNSSYFPVATPVLNPKGGSYSSAQAITISCATSDASIKYTIDGTNPSSNAGILYSKGSAIKVSSNITLMAIAFAKGSTDSAIVSEIYKIILPRVATPVLSPSGGSYSSAQSVSISSSTAGASIRYTVNGVDPTTSSVLYSSPLSISSTTTLKAKAFMNGMTESEVASAVYTISSKVATPVLSPSGGSYSSAQSVSISSSTAGASIRYTVNGVDPTTSSVLYSSPLSISSTTTLKAKAFMNGMTESDSATETYTIEMISPRKVSTPTFSPVDGTYSSVQIVVLSCATSGATIRYTIDGSEPGYSLLVYSEPISVSSTTTLKAKAFASEMTDSDTAMVTYTFNVEPVAVLDHFELDTINSQNAYSDFTVRITAKDQTGVTITNYNGSGSLSDRTGFVKSIFFSNGVCYAQVKIDNAYTDNKITVNSGNKFGESNIFEVKIQSPTPTAPEFPLKATILIAILIFSTFIIASTRQRSAKPLEK